MEQTLATLPGNTRLRTLMTLDISLTMGVPAIFTECNLLHTVAPLWQ